MSNHSYGLWGYYGRDGDGRELTSRRPGSAAAARPRSSPNWPTSVSRRAVRDRRAARALAPELAAGDRVRAIAGLPDRRREPRARRRGARSPTRISTARSRLRRPARSRATVAGCDLDPAVAGPEARSEWIAAGAAVADMQTAALFALGERLGVAVAAGLVVAGRRRGAELGEDALRPRCSSSAAAARARWRPAERGAGGRVAR